MPRYHVLMAFALGALCLVAWPPDGRAAENYAFFHENVMGTSLELKVRADSADAARWAEARVLGDIDRLSAVFSGYDAASELSRWQGGPKRPAKVSPELFEVLGASDHWRNVSRGAFDPRVEALSQLWSRCAQEDRLPGNEELLRVKSLMEQDAWRLGPEVQTAERLSDCPVSLNGIAKGYIVEHACKVALDAARGVRGLMLNVGGDLHVAGDLVQKVGVVNPWADSETSDPVSSIQVRDRSVSTSGRSQRGFSIGGRWYSHVFDPRTATPVERTVSATVIAPTGVMADALAKIFSVLPVDESLSLARSLPDVECLIATGDGRVVRSPRWDRYESRPLLALADEKAAGAAPANGGSAEGYELVISFEINQPDAQGGRYRRPYVAIWVEDKDGFPVRNLTLWVSQGGPGPFQWLPDLKRWYRSDQVRKLVDKREMVFTISRPTRPAGKYTVTWDGKDDNGKPVASGDYTLYIEAAREHGTYQSIRRPIALAEKPFAEELKGNVEIKSAALEYRRKSQTK
ncbi:MAG: DUF2271 domain-containing protein [Isosphaeraceae bacterium]|nr:DUF2271 domain-containing protein [Isosphaeraceae bacterium]